MECSVYIATSVDGKIARADGNLDWLSIVEKPGEDYGYRAFFDSVDTIIVGRKTWETACGFPDWPYSGKRCVVLTHRRIDSKHGEIAWSGPVDALVRKLEAEGARHAYVDGGDVIRQFLAAGLVTSLTLSLVPIVLADGVPLFGADEHRLVLRSARSFESGLVQLVYGLK